MISTQRLIMILIAINLTIGLAEELYYAQEAVADDQLLVDISLLEEHEREVESESGVWGSLKNTGTRTEEGTIGNTIKWGWRITKIFLRGMYPFSFTAGDFDSPVEKAMVNLLVLFRSLLYVIIIIEVYMLIKNKKQT